MNPRALPRPGDLGRADAVRLGEAILSLPGVRARVEWTCPRCGLRHDEARTLIPGAYRCPACAWEGDPEWFGLRMLPDAGVGCDA